MSIYVTFPQENSVILGIVHILWTLPIIYLVMTLYFQGRYSVSRQPLLLCRITLWFITILDTHTHTWSVVWGLLPIHSINNHATTFYANSWSSLMLNFWLFVNAIRGMLLIIFTYPNLFQICRHSPPPPQKKKKKIISTTKKKQKAKKKIISRCIVTIHFHTNTYTPARSIYVYYSTEKLFLRLYTQP